MQKNIRKLLSIGLTAATLAVSNLLQLPRT